MNSTVTTVIFGGLMALILVAGVVYAWRIARGNPRDTLRSTRFKHLAYAIFGTWLLILAVALFLPASADSRVMRGLVLGLYFGLPVVAAVIWALGHWAYRGEQKAARADALALGLTVAPWRISPHALALLYGIGLFTVVPLAVAAGVLVIASAAGERLPSALYSTVLWMVLSVVGLSYLTIAAVHVLSQRRRVRRETELARKSNLGPPDSDSGPAH